MMVKKAPAKLLMEEQPTQLQAPRRSGARRFGMQPGGWIGLLLLVLLGGMAALAPVLATHPPNLVEPTATFSPPGVEHWMGTDNIGRDVWSRFLFGGRISLMVGVIAMAISATTGTLMGVIAGYYSGRVDSLLSWITEVLLAFPGILLALVIIAILGSGIYNVMVAVGIGSIPSFMRLARGQVLRVKELGYIEAARSLGANDTRLLAVHILPNILRPLLVLVTLGMGGAILEGASLSFLGLGAQPPDPEWGAMLSAGRGFLNRGWWIAVFPGLGIFLAVLGINLFGDAVSDLLDPRAPLEENR